VGLRARHRRQSPSDQDGRDGQAPIEPDNHGGHQFRRPGSDAGSHRRALQRLWRPCRGQSSWTARMSATSLGPRGRRSEKNAHARLSPRSHMAGPTVSLKVQSTRACGRPPHLAIGRDDRNRPAMATLTLPMKSPLPHAPLSGWRRSAARHAEGVDRVPSALVSS